ncbi:histone-lysine N-methyltransferase SETMAR [Trichonephila clavipes]|nr:histone-lysine N-methyltransferase SETMAR [Trichonephila clavipes]
METHNPVVCGEYNFSASKATNHDVVGDEIENNSVNPQTLVVENHHINPPEEPKVKVNADYDAPKKPISEIQQTNSRNHADVIVSHYRRMRHMIVVSNTEEHSSKIFALIRGIATTLSITLDPLAARVGDAKCLTNRVHFHVYKVAAVAEWYRHRIVAGFVTSSSPVPLKTRRVGQRCTLNLSRAETSSRWCGS